MLEQATKAVSKSCFEVSPLAFDACEIIYSLDVCRRQGWGLLGEVFAYHRLGMRAHAGLFCFIGCCAQTLKVLVLNRFVMLKQLQQISCVLRQSGIQGCTVMSVCGHQTQNLKCIHYVMPLALCKPVIDMLETFCGRAVVRQTLDVVWLLTCQCHYCPV